MKTLLRPLVLLALSACASTPSTSATPPSFPGALPLDSAAPAPDPATPAACAARRRALARELGDGALVLECGPAVDGRFLPDPDFAWAVGVAVPGSLLILEARGGALERETLFLPAKDPRFELWNGPRLAPGPEAELATGVASTADLAEVEQALAALALTWTERENALHGSGPLLLAAAGEDGCASPRPLLDGVQVIKDAGEIAAMRATVDITQAALADAMRAAVPGAYEYTAEALIESGFRRRGASGPGFPSIAGSGLNTCILHYLDNGRRLEEGDLLVMDVGALTHGYCADVTRTIPVSGRFTPRQREIYTAVYRASREAAAVLRPGATLRDAHKVAAESLERSGGLKQYFLHSVGHGLGLRVHDAPRGNLELRPGMVVTIEPGVYIPEERLGVRIEDDYLITEDGAELLSDDLPSEPDELERFLAHLRQ